MTRRPERRLLFRLALALGKTVGEIEETMSSAEFAEWIAFVGLEPLPDPWLQTAQISAIMASCWSRKKHTVEEFLPRPSRPERLSPEQSAGLLKGMFKSG